MPERLALSADAWRLATIIVVALVVSLMFLSVIRPFLMGLVLAAITAAMARPLYHRIYRAVGHRSHLASGITLIILLIMVVGPLLGILYLAAVQAAGLADSLRQLANEVQQVQADGGKINLPDWVPLRNRVDQVMEWIVSKFEEIAQTIAGYFLTIVSAVTRGAVAFFLQFFIFLYALFYFVQMEDPILRQLLRGLGLAPDTRARIEERVEAISRATLKGTLTIALIQGTLGGLGFLIAGIPGAAFWTVVMTIAAMIPAVGATIVLFCGAAYLAIEGSYVWAGALAIWAAFVVGTIDNILRPTMVGRDAKMPDLMILISTLGGLAYFGAAGLVLGPVLAGVFLTVWQELAAAFEGDQPETVEGNPQLPDAQK